MALEVLGPATARIARAPSFGALSDDGGAVAEMRADHPHRAEAARPQHVADPLGAQRGPTYAPPGIEPEVDLGDPGEVAAVHGQRALPAQVTLARCQDRLNLERD